MNKLVKFSIEFRNIYIAVSTYNIANNFLVEKIQALETLRANIWEGF